MSAPQEKETSKSEGSHLSIDDYFERQKAKYGDVVDFDDDDEDMEANRTPRAAPAARDSWMSSASEISDRYGNSVPPNEVPVYVRSAIKDDAVAAELHFDAERIKGVIITSDSSMSSDGFKARRHLLAAKCPSGRHFVKVGTRLLTITV
ncbi:hypothetical protein ON010_g3031 [Phytophthora cinnamomi]|nr:hypothetical protein ON010_g3031 [Phytophthora cinnamomi]